MPRTDIAGVESYEPFGRGVRLDCSIHRARVETLEEQQESDPNSEAERTVPIELRFYNPSTFRFELRANPEAGPYETYMEYDDEAISTDVSVSVTERTDTLVVESGALRLRIGTDQWRFEVETDAGELLFREQHGDTDAKEQRRAHPLGFTEQQVNNWPLQVSDIGTSFVLDTDEHVFGLGEKFTAFDKRGQTVDAWTTQPNGAETEKAYKNVPFYLSSRGYGLLVDTTNRVTFDLGDTSTISGQISVFDDTFAFVFFAGPEFSEILQTYTALTGRPKRPPKWSFGLWMSKYGYESREELEAVTARLRDEEIPCDVVHLDPYWMRDRHECDFVWDREAFPDPEGMIDSLHEEGFQLCLWEHPYLTVGSDAFEEARDNGYLVRDSNGDPYILDRLSISTYRGGIVDFTDPGAVEWYKQQHRRLLDMGVDVFKTDFGEYLPRDAVLANGKTGEAMRNVYPHLYQQAVHEAMVESVGEEAVVFARSGWIGTQQYPVHWPGDPRTTFGSMGAVLRGGLSLMLSGYAFWSHDMGGFKGTPSAELYVRDAQFGLLTSHARFHGTTPREPWEFGPEATEIVRKFARLRYSLIPYIYTYAEHAGRTGLPVMRPLVLEYQDDPRVYDLSTQYLLGTELLVSPVLVEGGTTTVYLPDDEWVDWWTGERCAGPGTLNLEVPLDEVPLFQRVGSIVPTREPTQTVQEGTPDEVELRTVLGSDDAARAEASMYDADRDELVGLSIEHDGTTITATASARPELFSAAIDTVGPDPERVVVNGVTHECVDSDPGPGEWTRDPERDAVVINFDG